MLANQATILAQLAEMKRLHETLLVKRPKQKEIARMMGVHPSTLCRRRKRERIQRILDRVS